MLRTMLPCARVSLGQGSCSGLSGGVLVLRRGSLEVGDIFSDISANSLEMTLLGCSGQVCKHSGSRHYAACRTRQAVQAIQVHRRLSI